VTRCPVDVLAGRGPEGDGRHYEVYVCVSGGCCLGCVRGVVVIQLVEVVWSALLRLLMRSVDWRC
jgi:hypothetical protein